VGSGRGPGQFFLGAFAEAFGVVFGIVIVGGEEVEGFLGVLTSEIILAVGEIGVAETVVDVGGVGIGNDVEF